MAHGAPIPDLGEVPHQIVEELMSLMVPGQDEAWVLNEKGRWSLETGLRSMPTKDRPDAVQALIRLAFVLENRQGLKQAAAAILHTVESIGSELRGKGHDRARTAEEQNSAAGQRFGAFSGGRPKTAPTLGEEAPKGSTKLAALGFIPRRV